LELPVAGRLQVNCCAAEFYIQKNGIWAVKNEMFNGFDAAEVKWAGCKTVLKIV
jgi:hypothetical protein